MRRLRLAVTVALAALPPLTEAAQSTLGGSSSGSSVAAALQKISHAQSYLERHGITLEGFVQLDGSHVLAGGLPHPLGLDLQHLIDVGVTLDTGELLGWSGGTLFVDAQSHSGPNVINEQVPALADPDNMDAYASTSVDRAWFGQDLAGGKVHLQAGLMYVDDQFLTVPYGGNFVSLDFSSDASISTFVLPTYPKGSWGGDVFFNPTRSLSFSAGAFRDRETELPYDPGGQLFVSEEAWQGSWHGLPYKLQLGAWLDTGRFRRFVGGVVHHAEGVYAVASDKLWQPAGCADRGIGWFFQFGSAPPAVAPVRRHYGTGLVWTGPFQSRPHDEIGVAWSDSLLTPETVYIQRYESEIEAYYQLDVWNGLTIQPDLEYWEHPGGGSTPATLLGLIRVMYSF